MPVVKMQFSVADMLSAQKYHLTQTHNETIEYFFNVEMPLTSHNLDPSPQPPHNELLNDM